VARIGVQVASALEYAHKQGVLLRDIKPSNLLLDTHGTVWVTDFGLAKAEDQDKLTQSGDVIGTLRYMPPEAFEGKSDARSDVYCLGLTLYELLAFRPAFDEAQRPRLFKQISDSGPVGLDRLNRAIPRDLVTVVHKAIDRDPGHRYQTAAEMLADLQRFLADEPILARRPSVTERLLRWAHHHPGVAASLAAIMLLLILGLVSALLAAGANRRLADEREAERINAEQEKDRAEASFKMALETVDRFFTQVGESSQLKAQGMEKFRQEMLQNAKEFYERFIRERLDAPEVRHDLGLAHIRLAKIDRALGDYAAAQALAEKAIEILTELARVSPDSAEVRRDLAASHFELGSVCCDTGRLDKAQSAYRQALVIQQTLAGDHPEAVEYRRALATTQCGLGLLFLRGDHLDQAQASLEQAVATWKQLVGSTSHVPEDRHGLATAQHRLGATYALKGRSDKAEAMLKETASTYRALVQDYPNVPAYHQSLARNYGALGNLYFNDMQQPEKAEAALQQALEISEKLAREHPDVLEFVHDVGGCYMLLAAAAQLAGRSDAALARGDKAIEFLERAVSKGNKQARTDLLNARVNRAAVLAGRGDHARAADEADEVARHEGLNTVNLYSLACLFAQASAAAAGDSKLAPAGRGQLKAKYADRAVEFLRQAVAKGFRSAPLLKSDRDLGPLRSREDFQKLVQEVEKKSAK
jgi:tetratricopeptide (TPR) repeat protein